MYTHENAGLLYYKFYYSGIDFSPEMKKDTGNESRFKQANERILKIKLPENEVVDPLETLLKGISGFEARTTYPGLLIGSGYQHEVNIQGEWKLGFFFDHTLGLPVIPGSSVKGVVRSAFKFPDLIKFLLKKPDFTAKDLSALEADMFEGGDPESGEDEKPRFQPRPMGQHDTWFDALPVKNGPQGLFARDTLTPHNPTDAELGKLREPTPLPFLKVMADVTFRFRFKLHDNAALGISAADKLALIEQIVLYFGLGAKTSVGYGRFVNAHSAIAESTGSTTPPPPLPPLPQAPENHTQAEFTRAYKQGKYLTGKVVNNENGVLRVEYTVENQTYQGDIKYPSSASIPIGAAVNLGITDPGNPAKKILPRLKFGGLL